VWHPDKFADLDHKRRAEEKFKEILEAYEVLKDPQGRQEYNAQRDQEEHQGEAQATRAEDLYKQEEVAWRRAEDELQPMAQAKAGPHFVLLRTIFLFLILLCMLLMWIYDPEWFSELFFQ
jgi:curved DNA-binding protein CbpA